MSTEDVVKNGDVILVKCIGVDEKGRVKFSRRAAMKDRDQALQAETAEAPSGVVRLCNEPDGTNFEGPDSNVRPFFVRSNHHFLLWSIPLENTGERAWRFEVCVF